MCPQGATLTKNAPGIFSGNPASKNINAIINKINGDITNFKIEMVEVNLLITLWV